MDTKGENQSFIWIPRLNYLSLFILILGLLVWLISTLRPDIFNLPIGINANTPYLLSSIAQSLAAVLALVFTTTLIVSQLSSRYSHRIIAHFFDVYAICYLALFVIAVIFPILLLSNPNVVLIKASLILSSVCIVLLIPYFLRFKYMLMPEYLLSRVTNQALNKLKANATIEPRDVITLSDIAMSSQNIKDYETFGNAMRCLFILFNEILRLEWENPDTGNEITDEELVKMDKLKPKYRRFVGLAPSYSPTRHAFERRICDIAIICSNDPIAISQIYKAYEIETINIIKSSRRIATNIILFLGQEISVPSICKGSVLHGNAAVMSFQNIAIEALRDDQKEIVTKLLEDILFYLSWIGVQAYNAGLDDIVKNDVMTITNIGKAAAQKKNRECVIESAARLYFLFGVIKSGQTISSLNYTILNTLTEEIYVSLISIEKEMKSPIMGEAFNKSIEWQSWVDTILRDRKGLLYKHVLQQLYEKLKERNNNDR